MHLGKSVIYNIRSRFNISPAMLQWKVENGSTLCKYPVMQLSYDRAKTHWESLDSCGNQSSYCLLSPSYWNYFVSTSVFLYFHVKSETRWVTEYFIVPTSLHLCAPPLKTLFRGYTSISKCWIEVRVNPPQAVFWSRCLSVSASVCFLFSLCDSFIQ